MGKYINLRGEQKEDWLARNGVVILEREAKNYLAIGKIPVCLLDNGMFTAAGICDTDSEIDAFSHPDGRMKLWYAVPAENLKEFL